MVCSDIAYNINRKIAISFTISNNEEVQNRSDIEWDDYVGRGEKIEVKFERWMKEWTIEIGC